MRTKWCEPPQYIPNILGLAMERIALWRRAIETKYGGMWRGEGGCSCSMQGPYGVGLWNYIRKGWDDFYPFIIFKVGDGSCFKFWCDPWCERLPLQNIFPDLYNIASNKDASMAELLSS